MTPVQPALDLCPVCARTLDEGRACLHCAMQEALEAVTLAPEIAAELDPSSQAGFATIADPVLPIAAGRFQVLGPLGAGGMGTVYAAEDTVLGRTVALKMIRAFRFASAEEQQRFEREARATAKLDHPHIVPVYEVGELEGHAFLVMKLITGGTLADRLPEGAMRPEEAVGIMAKVAAAVHHAHQQGVLHRDLKPSNILLDEAGQPWLTDFGMARVNDGVSELTLHSAQLGTPHYMSPEQAAGRAREVSTASDVWALGAVLYQLLSGKLPYTGETHLEIMHLVVTDDAPKLMATNRRERDLAVLVERCLQKEASQRLGSAGILASELERWLRDEPIQSRSSPKSPPWWWAAAAPLLVVSGLVLHRSPPDDGAVKPPSVNYVIRTQGSVLRVTDVAGLPDSLLINERQPGQIEFVAGGSHFSLNDAAPTNESSGPIPLAGITRIELDAGAGKDRIEIAGFTGDTFPALRIRGGAGDDTVMITGRIAFSKDASFDLNDEAANPGKDRLLVSKEGQLLTSGVGAITVKVSQNIQLEGKMETVDGDITLEANLQSKPTQASFRGVSLMSGQVRSQGKGSITIAGRGGSLDLFQFGVAMKGESVIEGGAAGVVRITGQGGSSDKNDSSGVNIENQGCQVITRGADIEIKGTGGGAPGSGSNNGIVIVKGKVAAGGAGTVKLIGEGGACTHGYQLYTRGVLLRGPTALVTSSGGDVTVTGVASTKKGDGKNDGVMIESGAVVTAGGRGKVTVHGSANLNSTGDGDGVSVCSPGTLITSSGGDVTVVGEANNTESADVRVYLQARITTAKKGGQLTIRGRKLMLSAGAVDETTVLAGSAKQLPQTEVQSVSPEQPLTPPAELTTAIFGRSVAIDGDTMVVGAPMQGTGMALVYVHEGERWMLQATLSADQGMAGDEFGRDVALHGNTLVVGAHLEDTTARDSGAVYVFNREGTAWKQTAYLKAAAPHKMDGFGRAVAVHGDTVVVGSRLEDGADIRDAGAAYVFVRQGLSWVQQARLVSPQPGPLHLFGMDVDVEGSTLIVGADGEGALDMPRHYYNVMQPSVGAAYVFTRSGSDWTLQSRLAPTQKGSGGCFGYSVALAGDTALIGAYRDNNSAATDQPDLDARESGAAFVFVREGKEWRQQAYLKASNLGAGHRLGFNVALDGDAALIGAYAENRDASGALLPEAGAAYVFQRRGAAWTQTAYLKASTPTPLGHFGMAVGITGRTLVVGALGRRVAPFGPGQVWTYRLP